jgi:CBS domain-containing protein
VREIVLLPIGGVSRMENPPQKPVHELLIAAAGPAVNVAIAAVLLVALGASTPLAQLDRHGLLRDAKVEPSVTNVGLWLLAANITLALFNLIPAFPMDGGRLLRAALALAIGPARATAVAATIGQVLAMAIGFYAVMYGHMLLALVALFIFLGAGGERAEEIAREVLGSLPVRDAYNKHAITLAPGDQVSTVVDYLLTSYQPDFAVCQGRTLLGIVTRQDVVQALARDTRDLYVAGIMKRDVVRVDVSATVHEARKTMLEKATRVAAVFDGEDYLGLVSLEDIGEALLVATFVKRQEEARRAGEA